MFTERTLFERLSRPRTRGARTLADNTPDLVRSVLHNLQNILNARLGNAAAQPDLGMPAPSEITRGGADGVERIIRGLRACVEKYEPRLAGIDVVHLEKEDDDHQSLRFQVTARIANSKDETYISFDTLVDPSGRFMVQD
jgi:type VI secretion system protein